MVAGQKRAGAAATAPGSEVVTFGKLTPAISAERGEMARPPATRGAAIAAKCRDCCHDSEAAGTWRAQASVCTVTACPLWRFRPLIGAPPAWLAARDPDRLPPGWIGLAYDAAVGGLRTRPIASVLAMKPGQNDISPVGPGVRCPTLSHAPESGPDGHREGDAA